MPFVKYIKELRKLVFLYYFKTCNKSTGAASLGINCVSLNKNQAPVIKVFHHDFLFMFNLTEH